MICGTRILNHIDEQKRWCFSVHITSGCLKNSRALLQTTLKIQQRWNLDHASLILRACNLVIRRIINQLTYQRGFLIPWRYPFKRGNKRTYLKISRIKLFFFHLTSLLKEHTIIIRKALEIYSFVNFDMPPYIMARVRIN